MLFWEIPKEDPSLLGLIMTGKRNELGRGEPLKTITLCGTSKLGETIFLRMLYFLPLNELVDQNQHMVPQVIPII